MLKVRACNALQIAAEAETMTTSSLTAMTKVTGATPVLKDCGTVRTLFHAHEVTSKTNTFINLLGNVSQSFLNLKTK